MTMFTEEYRQMFRDWDKPRPTSECLHCHGSGIAPGDGETECGFCYDDEALIEMEAEAEAQEGGCRNHGLDDCRSPECDPHGVFHAELVQNEAWGGTE